MKTIAIIPARYASTRLPAKPLRLIAGKTLIQRVYDAVKDTDLFDRVIIATDHEHIFQHAKSLGADIIMTSKDHKSGTDRIAECAKNIKTDLILNVQGDEPFISKEPLQILIDLFKDNDVTVASLMTLLKNFDDVKNPNIVKVVCDIYSNALYFSRAAIPYPLLPTPYPLPPFFRHIGVYAFTPEMLQTFVSLPPSKLEQIEKLEQLRLLENGYKIKMALTDYDGIGIDTEEDIKKAEMRMQK